MSAIELYRKAYDLDYRKGDWESAQEIYEKIVEKFPHSDEKEYATVHLERIENLKSDPDDLELQPVRAKGSGGGLVLAIISLVLTLVLAGSFVFAFMEYVQIKKHNKYTNYLLNGFLNQNVENNTEAVYYFKKAQSLEPSNPMAYNGLAELRLSLKQYKLATIEAKKWRRFCKTDPRIFRFEQRLKSAMKDSEGAK